MTSGYHHCFLVRFCFCFCWFFLSFLLFVISWMFVALRLRITVFGVIVIGVFFCVCFFFLLFFVGGGGGRICRNVCSFYLWCNICFHNVWSIPIVLFRVIYNALNSSNSRVNKMLMFNACIHKLLISVNVVTVTQSIKSTSLIYFSSLIYLA